MKLTWRLGFYHGDIRRNAKSGFSIVTIDRVAIIFFELGVLKIFMQKF